MQIAEKENRHWKITIWKSAINNFIYKIELGKLKLICNTQPTPRSTPQNPTTVWNISHFSDVLHI